MNRLADNRRVMTQDCARGNHQYSGGGCAGHSYDLIRDRVMVCSCDCHGGPDWWPLGVPPPEGGAS